MMTFSLYLYAVLGIHWCLARDNYGHMNVLFSTVQKSVKLMDVYEELIIISHKWFDLGLRLELEEGKLETIEHANPNKPQNCLRAVLSTWLKQDSRRTWQFLCAALRSNTVGENKLANTIEAKYT